jgi:integrase
MEKRKNRKLLLTDRLLRGSTLQPAAPGTRITIWDSAIPGGNIQITATGNISYGLQKRRKGQRHAPRRLVGYAWKLGQKPPIALADLHDMARAMLLDYAKGVDPKVRVRAAQEAAEKDSRETFSAVAKDFLADHVAGLRSGHSVKLVFEAEILPVLGKRPIAEISDSDIARLVKGIAKTRVHRARNVLALLKGFFRWTIGQRAYGLRSSPCDGLTMNGLAGRVEPRQRVLTDGEIAAIGAATAAMGYPAGPFVRLLLLTGQRLREVSEMAWSEVDLDKALWTIAPSRMKNGAAHVVPLASESLALLRSVPCGSGKYVFSTCGGRKPISGFSKLKSRIDAALPEPITPWRFHDLRRTMQTGLSMLGVPDVVAELAIAHSQKGSHRVYNQHGYLTEKRNAMERWEAHLRSICAPVPTDQRGRTYGGAPWPLIIEGRING